MKKQNKRRKVISRETAMLLTLNGFVVGMLIEKIILNGFSWISTTGLFG